ncbi:MAG: excinuclease ABC subunit C [Chloroflexi bacterium]|nr:excinuclease ABC subunit C [Chloroflexota bacterium]
MAFSEKIQGILNTLPLKPGCYLMKDADDKIIYIGKAINLRNRVRSYFHATAQHTVRIQRMVSLIDHIDWIVVESELEALILEMNLIKKNRPQYNIQLKDDKRYPYIKIEYQLPYPRISVTRQMVHDGSHYFGPYTSVWAVHQTLDLLRRIFPYLTCDREITGTDTRACLYYDIKLCSAPCIGAISQKEYYEMMVDIGNFLDGKSDTIVSRLQEQMAAASDELRFERAATLRDQIHAISRVVEKQKIVSDSRVDSDVIALARSDNEACVQLFFIRNGKLIGQEYFMMKGTEDEKDQAVLSEFLKQYYSDAATIPDQMLLPMEVEEKKIIQQWLRQKRGVRRLCSKCRRAVKIKIWSRWLPRMLLILCAPSKPSGRTTPTSKARRLLRFRVPFCWIKLPTRLSATTFRIRRGRFLSVRWLFLNRGFLPKGNIAASTSRLLKVPTILTV